ncbi:hypothetical protein GEMRC1_010313 [Eukaryota sp. GEM-RC1]
MSQDVPSDSSGVPIQQPPTQHPAIYPSVAQSIPQGQPQYQHQPQNNPQPGQLGAIPMNAPGYNMQYVSQQPQFGQGFPPRPPKSNVGIIIGSVAGVAVIVVLIILFAGDLFDFDTSILDRTVPPKGYRSFYASDFFTGEKFRIDMDKKELWVETNRKQYVCTPDYYCDNGVAVYDTCPSMLQDVRGALTVHPDAKRIGNHNVRRSTGGRTREFTCVLYEHDRNQWCLLNNWLAYSRYYLAGSAREIYLVGHKELEEGEIADNCNRAPSQFHSFYARSVFNSNNQFRADMDKEEIWFQTGGNQYVCTQDYYCMNGVATYDTCPSFMQDVKGALIVHPDAERIGDHRIKRSSGGTTIEFTCILYERGSDQWCLSGNYLRYSRYTMSGTVLEMVLGSLRELGEGEIDGLC